MGKRKGPALSRGAAKSSPALGDSFGWGALTWGSRPRLYAIAASADWPNIGFYFFAAPLAIQKSEFSPRRNIFPAEIAGEAYIGSPSEFTLRTSGV